MFALDFLPPWLNTFSFVLIVALGIVLLFVAMLSLRNPIVGKLGIRNIPRRPTQTALIVAGLTLGTVIIVSALATGDTLDYSVQRYAVNAYGEIDEIISPPLLTVLAGLNLDEGEAESPFVSGTEATDTETTSTGTAAAEAEAASPLSGTGYDTILNILAQGLPGISTEDYQALRARVEDEPLIDGVAPAIVFPTIIRNVRSGQGEPLGLIFAVDSQYDQEFGLHSVDGTPVTMEALNPGVGNVFQSATDLFRMASQAARNAGFTLQLSDVAVGVAAAGALASGDMTETQANAFLTELLGEDAPQLPAGSLAQLQELLPQQGEQTSDEGVEDGSPTAEQGEGAQADSDPATGVSIPALAALNLPDASELLSSLNLNTMRAEIDRVLAQFGLQLRQGDVYLSRLGAERLDARTGDLLEIFLGPIPLPYRVAGIVEEAGPVGALSSVVMMPLSEAQHLLAPVMPGQVNAVLVSNLGGPIEGIQHTAAVSDRLRVLTLDEEGLTRVAAILSRPDVLQVVEQEVATAGEQMPNAAESMFLSFLGDAFGNIASSTMPNVEQLGALPAVLRQNDVEALRPILGHMGNRTWLMGLPLDDDIAEELTAAVGEMTQMEVLDVLNKQTIVSVSGVAGTLFSTVFSIFGIFSIMAGVLLIFMIFVMLASERRSEMGMARAIGMQRGHLVQMFVTEGMLYDLVAALVGVVLGLGVSYLMIGFLGGLFKDVSSQFSGRELFFQFYFHTKVSSIIIAYCLGVLLTFVVVTVASYQVSRLNIVTAIRDLPDRDGGAPRSRLQKILRAVLGPLLLAGGGYVIWQGIEQGLTVILVGATLALVGVAFILGWGLVRWGVRPETRHRIVYTIIGLGMLVAWGVSWGSLLGEGASLFTGNPAWVPLAFALSAPMIILGGILVVMFNAGAWVWAANRLLGGIGALTPVLRTAIAYPLSSRFRTGMAMTMFAMVITTVVVMSIVIQATQTLVTPDEQRTAGFDIQLNSTLLSFFDPVADLQAAISERAPAVAGAVEAVGRLGQAEVEVRESGDAFWIQENVAGMDAGFLAQAAQVYPLRMRAESYVSDAAVWQALQERDDVIVVTAEMLPGLFDRSSEDEPETVQVGGFPLEVDEEEMAEGEEAPGGTASSAAEEDDVTWRFYLASVDPAAETLSNVVVQVRNDADEIISLEVIGVLDTMSTLAGQGLQVGPPAFERVASDGFTAQQWFVSVAEGTDVRAAAQALERAFLSSGLDATVMADSFAQGQQITRGILQLFQGFMALGLLVGIAALGVISSRTVVERRQQVGMLRAIGYQPSMVALSFVLESSFIALVGIGIGTAAGVLLGRNMLGEFFDLVNPGTFTLPWLEIGGILLLAYLFSLVMTILPAIQASRIYPAEALRYE